MTITDVPGCKRLTGTLADMILGLLRSLRQQQRCWDAEHVGKDSMTSSQQVRAGVEHRRIVYGYHPQLSITTCQQTRHKVAILPSIVCRLGS